ncbi:MAG TPA: peptidase M13, partial [Thermoanaerobaculia bacterium]
MISRLVAFAISLTLFIPGARAEDPAAAPNAPPTAAERYGKWGIDLDGMDRSVKPGDDFFRYVNGKWAATTQIPPDKTSFGAFAILRDL